MSSEKDLLEKLNLKKPTIKQILKNDQIKKMFLGTLEEMKVQELTTN